MGKMGIGYGSEYQLLRFMGRHRKFLDSKILQSIGKVGFIDWLDFNFSYSNSSNSDNELKGIQPFQNEPFYKEIEKNWEKFWPQTGSAQSWDAVFKIDDEWYFVEAKAHKDELIDPHKKLDAKSLDTITNAFNETKSFFEVNQNNNWIDSKYYQLCNRLSFAYFCQKNAIKVKILYIDFINGYKKNGFFIRDNVRNSQEWNDCFENIYKTLGLSNRSILDKYLFHVYIDCNDCR